MGRLSLRVTPDNEDEVLRICKIMGATEIKIRMSETEIGLRIFEISGPQIPDYKCFCQVHLRRRIVKDDNGFAIAVKETYSWAAEL